MIEQSMRLRAQESLSQMAHEVRCDIAVQAESGAFDELQQVAERIRAHGKEASFLHEIISNNPDPLKKELGDIVLPGKVVYTRKWRDRSPKLSSPGAVVRTSVFYDPVMVPREDDPFVQDVIKLKALSVETGSSQSLLLFHSYYCEGLVSMTPVHHLGAIDWKNRLYLLPTLVEDLFQEHIQRRLYRPLP